MPSAEEFWPVAAKVVSERGHLVIGFSEGSEQPELGSTLDNVLGFKPQRPFTVVGHADWTDWCEQVETFYRLRPAWGRGTSGDPNGTYYRVKCGDAVLNLDSVRRVALPDPSSSSVGPAVPSFSGYAQQPVTEGLRYEPFWTRAVARTIDYIFISVFVARIAVSLFRFLLTTAAGGQPPLWVLVRFQEHRSMLFFASICGYFAYQTLCTSINGSTLGKRMLSLAVLQDDGSRCRPRSAIIRELAFFIDSFFFGAVAYSGMKGNEQHKRYGDWWADTIVINRPMGVQEGKQGAGRFMIGLMLGVMAEVVFVMLGLSAMMMKY